MAFDLYLRNGTIVTEAGRFVGGIGVRDGKVAEVVLGDIELPALATLDTTGKIVLPGIIDAHTHFSEPGRDFEGYRTGSRAAAAGGVTTVLDMPLNDLPPTTTAETLAAKRAMVEGESVIDYAHWGGFIDNNLENLDELDAGGVVAFKAFMRHISDFPQVNDGLLYAGLQKIGGFGNLLGVHAENEPVISHLRERLIAQGRIDRAAWNESRPLEQEMDAIARAIFWAKAAGSNLYICHISAAEAVALVRQAAGAGVTVFAETCAHYLFFDMEDYFRVGPRLRASPPIRSREHVEALWECVLRGDIDVISSDHSPFPPERYEQGKDNVWEGGGGVTGIQSMLPAVITEGVHKRGMSWELVVKLMSSNPARIFGIYPQKGAILPGSDADFTVIDPDVEWTLKADDLHYRYKGSPYAGCNFKGRVSATLVRGKVVFENANIIAPAGYGQLVQRISRYRSQ